MNTIRKRREMLGIRQEDLANKLGVDRSAVGKWETGENNPRFDVLPALARALDCTIDELFADETKAASDG